MAELKHAEALELIGDDWQADCDNRKDAMDDLKFLSGDQWDASERGRRAAENRPCLSVPQLHTFVNQVAGDIRQAQPGIEVYPVDDLEDVPLANVYEGLIRQIEYRSGATSVYSHMAESAVRCGIGHLRLETEYTNDSVFEQDIRIKRIIDPLSVIWDAGAIEIDRSDARHCWVTDWVHKNEFKRRFKDSEREGVDVPVDGHGQTDSSLYWRNGDFVRIAEYWHYKQVKRTLVLTSAGKTIDITDLAQGKVDRMRAEGSIARERVVNADKVYRRVMDGAGWLGDEEEWAGRYIPVVPCIGSEIAYNGKVIRAGLVRYAKDSQKLYNFWASATAELIGKSPKAPWLVTPDMIAGFEGYWEKANVSNLPYLLYNPDPVVPGAMPSRQQPPTIQPAMWQERALAREDLRQATGIHDASLGARGNETSGRAILARQREGDVGSYYFVDNFSTAMRRVGQLLVDLIPRIYDSDRQVRILSAEGQEAFIPINRQALSADGTPVLINDLSDGRFDVRVRLGASYTTSRVEAREQMAQAMQNNPALWSVIGDLFFKNSDYPGSEEIAQRLRRAIDPKLLQEDTEQPDPMAEMANRLMMQEKQVDIAAKQADIEKTAAEAGLADARRQLTLAETVTEMDHVDSHHIADGVPHGSPGF